MSYGKNSYGSFKLNSTALQNIILALFFTLPTIGLSSGPAYAPIIFSISGIIFIYYFARHRTPPLLPPTSLIAVVTALTLLCWVGWWWSVDPQQTARTAKQFSLIALGAILCPPLAHGLGDKERRRLLAGLAVAVAVGAVLVGADMASGYKLTLLRMGWGDPGQFYKYNRGINYLMLIAWPLLAGMVALGWRRQAWAVAALVAVPVVLGLSGSARFGAVAGAAVLLLSLWLPRWTPRLLATVSIALPVLLPALLRGFAPWRPLVAPHIPNSGLHRLEIWDYMSLRILDRPLFGWGLGGAKHVPISPQELQGYVWADGVGIHPHNQWLEIWVELGAAGMALAGLFLWLMLKQAARLPDGVRPFAYAAYAAAMACSLVNYEISTDSWWAAIAATCFLFVVAKRATSSP